MQNLILASQSAQRKILLKAMGIVFEAIPADIDEKAFISHSFEERAKLIARKKVEKIAALHPNSFIIGADTYSEFNNKALEKPENLEEAKEMLRLQSGNWLKTHTGLAFYDCQKKEFSGEVVTTNYKIRQLSEFEIDYYVNNNPVMTWSAGFSSAYHEGMTLIEEVNGSLTGLTHGFPIEKIVPFLKKNGLVAK